LRHKSGKPYRNGVMKRCGTALPRMKSSACRPHSSTMIRSWQTGENDVSVCVVGPFRARAPENAKKAISGSWRRRRSSSCQAARIGEDSGCGEFALSVAQVQYYRSLNRYYAQLTRHAGHTSERDIEHDDLISPNWHAGLVPSPDALPLRVLSA